MSGKQDYTISLSNIVVYGFHGVHPEEKTLGQRFEIDLEYRLANPPFPWKDEERATVSYVNAHSIVSRVCAEKCCKLAGRPWCIDPHLMPALRIDLQSPE